MKKAPLALLLCGLFAHTQTSAQVLTQQNILQGVEPLRPDLIPMEEIILDRIIYNDNVYSQSRKTELGDRSRIDMAFRYHEAPRTFARLRFSTDPAQERYANKTSRFEGIFSRAFGAFTFQLDLELLTDDEEDGNDGGISLGPDLDSDDTFIRYGWGKTVFTFYPFNFRADVGDEFNTLDVTRINSIQGSPATINPTQAGNERITQKTVPGLEIMWFDGPHSVYAGFGVATYLYPTNSDFAIEDNPVATSWERKETTGFKAGYLYLAGNLAKVNLQFVGNNKTEETGALLESAASLNVFRRFGDVFVEYETTISKAGAAPYDTNSSTGWFSNLTPFQPVYSDLNGERQDWIGQAGMAYSLKVGLRGKDSLPYLSLKYQDEHFVFDGDESAHRLRTSDESQSHGGLFRAGIGSYFYYENIYFRPLLEWQKANNPVFTNSTDLREDRELSEFTKENFQLSVSVVYTFDGVNLNPVWWF